MNKAEYLTGEFVDYTGQTRKFVMAAVSVKDSFPEYISVGVSVCLPGDKFDEELGKKIAYGKAIKSEDHTIISTTNGILGGEIAKAFLQQESRYFINDPGRYIKGYKNRAAKYQRYKKINDYIEKLDRETYRALDCIAQLEDSELDQFTEAVNYLRVE